MQRFVVVVIGVLSLVGLVGHARSAVAEGMITVDNGSASPIKVAGQGGSAVVDAGAKGVEVKFEGGTDIGIDAKIWWIENARELCQLFVPWQRTVVVSGTSTIRCRSQ